jgi:hypothetical protein
MWRVKWFHLLNWKFEMCIYNTLFPLSIYDIRLNYVHLVVLISLLSISHEHIPILKMHCNYVKSDSNIYISKLIINITHFLSSFITYPFWDGRNSHKQLTNKTKQNQVNENTSKLVRLSNQLSHNTYSNGDGATTNILPKKGKTKMFKCIEFYITLLI